MINLNDRTTDDRRRAAGNHRSSIVGRLSSFLHRHWPELAAALAPLTVFWRIVFAGQVLYWGLPSLQFVPWRVMMNDALRAGHLPLWTPLLGMGAPLMANLQSAVFYPPNWVSLIIPPERAISTLAVLHLSFAGVGMVRLARRIGLGDFGSAVAGLSFGLSGYLAGRLWFITINNAMAWLPWIVLVASPPTPVPSPLSCSAGEGGGVARSAKRGVTGWGVRLSALLALQLLAGHAQSSFYTWLVAGAWIVWWSTKRLRNRPAVIASAPEGREAISQPMPRLLRALRALAMTDSAVFKIFGSLLKFALAVFFALCLAAIQLIPTFELLRLSSRADAAAYDFAVTYSFWPWRLFTLVAPNFFGHPADHNYWGYGVYWEDNAYLGLLPLLFAGYAVLFHHREHREHGEKDNKDSVLSVFSVVNFLCITAAVSILLALGKNTPIFPFFYRYVPGFSQFQAPARMLIGTTFAISLLAGIGADGWHASERKRYWARLGIAGSGAAFVLGIVGTITILTLHAVTFASGLMSAAAFALGAFILILVQPNAVNRWRWLVLPFLVFDLGLAAARLSPTTDPSFYHLASSFTLSEGRAYQFAGDEYRVKFRDFFRFKSFDPLDAQALRNSLLPNLSTLDGMASANNFDPLLSARYVEYVNAMESNPRLLDLADVRAVIKPMGTVDVRGGGAARVRVVYDVRFVDSGDAALAAITDPTFDPDTEVILEDLPPSPPFPFREGGAGGIGLRVCLPLCLFEREAGGEGETFTVTLSRDGYLVLSDTYYPGWRVFVDGEPRPLLRADYLFRAAAVPAGTHEVTFEYAPLSVTVGLAISLAAFALWVVLWLAPQRHREHGE